MVCDRCRGSTWDGIVPGSFPHLERHLQAKGIPVKLNDKGWIDWPS
jgi:hypothetical protein